MCCSKLSILFAISFSALAANLIVTAVGDLRITPRLIREHANEIEQFHLKGDVVFANFEGVLSDTPGPDEWKFSMPFRALDVVSAMGINTLSLANNHSLDLGRDSYQRTESTLRSRFTVAGREGREGVVNTGGHHVRLIAFSFGAVHDVNRLEKIPSIIRGSAGRKGQEIVIVSAHMGGENHLADRIPYAMEYFGREQRGNVVEFSHRCIDAGADLVLGHSPHVPRGIELYKNKLIVYSLGNFLFDYPGASLNLHAPGYAISIELNSHGDFQSARVESYDLQQGLPVADVTGKAYRMIRSLTIDNLHATNLSFPGKGLITKWSE